MGVDTQKEQELGPEAKFETVGDDVPGMRVQARLGRFS